MIGSTVEQYQILEQLGGGGMGQVYRALDLELDREVAIKCVRPELASLEDVTKRFRTEARTLAKLSHQNIATVYRFFSHEGQLFLVMELIEGRPFGKMLLEEGAQSPENVVSLMDQALSGLSYAHDHKVVHRDIKPGNLMLAGSDVVKVLDFGIAHLLDGDTRLTRVGSVVGTPAYMAPEQVLGRAVDPRTDLYSLGIVLYEMLTGKLPFEANSDFEVMQAKLEQEPRPLGGLGSSIPDALQSTISRALAKDMSQRFQTAQQFSDSLHASLTTAPSHFLAATKDPDATTVIVSQDAPTSFTDSGQQTKKTYGIALAVALSIALAGLLFGGVNQRSSDTPNSEPKIGEAGVAKAASESSPAPKATNTDANINANIDANSVTPATATVNHTASEAPDSSAAAGSPSPPKMAMTSDTQATSGSDSPFAALGPGQSVKDPVSLASNKTTAAPKKTPPQAPTGEPKQSNTKKIAVKPLAPTRQPRQAPAATYSVKSVKVSAHKTQKTGRFSRAAGYNGSFTLSGPLGDNREIEVSEFIEVRQDGHRLLREKVGSDTRKRGRFGTKKRVQELKLLPVGSYDIRLVFETKGKVIGTYDWKLKVLE